MTNDATPATATLPLTVADARLLSIAYHAVGIYTEGGRTPYTGPADAGGASGISIGVMQNDFGQNPSKTLDYAQAIVDWHRDTNKPLALTARQLADGLNNNALTADMRTSIKSFGATDRGADWVHQNFDVPHADASVAAAKRAFATPYGQAVIRDGTHVEEFAAFAMKVYNQYGPGSEGSNGATKSPGFGAFMDYLNNGSVVLKNNQPVGGKVTVTASHPGEYNRDDLLSFARSYADTRKKRNEAVYNGPQAALNSGALYTKILDSNTLLADSLRRAETAGDFRPSQARVDMDTSLTRAIFGANAPTVSSAIDRMEAGTAASALRVPVTLGQFGGNIYFDANDNRIAVRYSDGKGLVIGDNGYSAFDESKLLTDPKTKVSSLMVKQGDSFVNFAEVAIANSLPAVPSASTPTGGQTSPATETAANRSDARDLSFSTPNGGTFSAVPNPLGLGLDLVNESGRIFGTVAHTANVFELNRIGSFDRFVSPASSADTAPQTSNLTRPLGLTEPEAPAMRR
jgi:hypothetical protein